MDLENKKGWLDEHVVPLAQKHSLSFYAGPFWSGNPPTDVLVFLLAQDDEAWPQAVHDLLKQDDFRFDHMRDVVAVQVEPGAPPTTLFGGDGTPIYGTDGMASVRLIRKENDGTNLIVQVGRQYLPKSEEGGKKAASAVKGLFALFEDDPFEVIRTFGAQFGQA